ncbi:MAG: response regulator [Chloroflexota bacterium]|nr:response regulator [Chloroflexota bacterium]
MSYQRPAILIVEKDPATRELYRRELALSYQVFACVNGEEARQILSQKKIDLAVLEPVGCGWDLVDELKGSLPLIVCSTREVRQAHIKKELAACLVKPVLNVELFKSVEYVLAGVLK